MQTSRSARIRRRIGVTMMVSSLGIAGSVMTLMPAGAEDTVAAQADPVELEVTKTAYYVTNAGRAAPDTVTNGAPPGIVCLLVPPACPEEAEPLTGPLGGVVQSVENAPSEPQGTAPPGSLPISLFAGEDRYHAALQTALPELAPGNEAGTFVLRLQEIDPTYHSSSPMFRQAVLAAVASAGSREFRQEEFQKALEEDPAERGQYLGLEACPIVTAFEAGEGQPEEARPETDCLFGTNGIRLEDGTWEFDLTFAAKAWYAGTLPNEGVYLKPTAAPNLAYGDPDLSTHAQVTLAATNVQGAIDERPQPAPPAPFTPAPAPASPTFSAPVGTGNVFLPPPPVVSQQPQVSQEPVQETQTEPIAVPFIPEDVEPGSIWWIWLLVPIFLAGMYMTAQSLAEEVVLASDRQGAMMRLISNNGGGPAPSAPVGPRQGAMSRLVSRA